MSRLKLRNDDGIGMITVLLIMTVLSGLVVTATALAVNNTGNQRRDRQSLGALASGEAGVAQALQYLRTGNLAALTCAEPAAGSTPGVTCQGAGPSWTSATNPMQIRVDGGSGGCVASSDCFKVWIGTVQQFSPSCAARHQNPPGQCYGKYRIHATGISGNGPGARRIVVDAQASPYRYPLGVFSETDLSGNGNVGIHAESIYTGGCMINRQSDSSNGSGVQFQWDSANNRPVIDIFADQPAAAHAVGGISTVNNGTCTSNQGQGGPIHETGVCNSTFKWDQDNLGGNLTSGDACYGKYVRSDGTVYPTTSRFTAQDMQDIGYRPRGLTDAQYDALKAQAQAEGTYNIATTSLNSVLTSLVNSGVSSPVLYWDTASVDLHQSDLPALFSRAVNSTPGCVQNTLTIIVAGTGHNLSYQGGNTSPFLTAAIFVPDGSLTGQGGRNTIGTVFAKTIDLGGNIDFYLDACYANSPPGGTLDVQVTSFREDDGTDVN